jgi:predicted AAA+ superfamily ATPase
MKVFSRLLKVSKKRSFFLFGARSTGKSTLLKQSFTEKEALWCNLLKTEEEERFLRKPHTLYEMVNSLPSSITHVVIDEVQKVPKLLDVVHLLMGETKKIFVMTGSSARKLKRGGANLLAGRAFVYHFFPLTFLEIGDRFDLDFVLHWGSLPEVFQFDDERERSQFLQAYANTYLKEEIWDEHFIRQLDPYRKFLEVAAQCNGKIVNYSNIARDVGVEDKTVASFFTLLEDTLIGFFLEPFHNSFRKRLSEKPKFYFFDPGVVRALSRRLSIPIAEKTTAYGDAFEHFIILEILRLASYYEPEYRFSYIRTPSDVEVDLVIERPGKPLLFIEIKSADEIERPDLSSFIRLSKDHGHCEAICLSRDPYLKKIENVTSYFWRDGITHIFKKHLESHR